MKNMKQLCIVVLLTLPVFSLNAANAQNSADTPKDQLIAVATNEKAELQPAENKGAIPQSNDASVEPEEEGTNVVLITGVVVMSLLMVVVLVKSKKMME